MTLLRGFSGVLAGGLVVLALALGVVWVVATNAGSAGPAPGLLAWHVVAAVVAVVAQVRADRGGRGADVGVGVVLVVSAVVLGALWLA